MIIKNSVKPTEALFPVDDDIQVAVVDLGTGLDDDPEFDVTPAIDVEGAIDDTIFEIEDEVPVEAPAQDDVQNTFGGVERRDRMAVRELNRLIGEEQAAVNSYSDILGFLKDQPSIFGGIKGNMQAVIEDILSEENKHIGQLQQLVASVNPEQNDIEEGEVEAEEQLAESVTTPSNKPSIYAEISKMTFVDPAIQGAKKSDSEDISGEDVCTLADTDDEF